MPLFVIVNIVVFLVAAYRMAQSRSAAYCKYYASQQGGEISVFRGGQHGAGLGDILRGILRFIAPIALRGVSTFANSTLQARHKGASFGDAARSAIGPSISAMSDSLRSSGSRSQQGSGMFHGEQGVPFARAIAYKGRASGGKKRKRSAAHFGGKKKQTSKRKRVQRDTAKAEYNF